MDGFDIYRYPRNFFLNITGNCNLRCVYCSSVDFNKKSDMTKKQLEHILNELKEHGALKVVLTGGEPTLHKDFIWAVSEFIKYFGVSINTNGTNISSYLDFFDQFEYKNRVSFNVSIDSMDEEKNALTRGHYDLEIVINNIKKLNNMGYKVSVLCTVTNMLDESDLELFSEFIKENPRIGISLNDLKLTGRAGNQEKKLLPNLEKIKMINQKFGAFQNFDFGCSEDGKCDMTHLLACGAGRECLAIAESGDVFPCTAMYIKLGNIFENTIKDICDKSAVIKELKDMRKMKLDCIKECKNCQYNCVCHGGCRANAYLATGSLYGVDPYCWYNGKYFK